MEQFIKEYGAKPEHLGAYLKVFINILMGVNVLHSNRQVHRDIAPKNIFLTGKLSDGSISAKLGDFGIAKDVMATKVTMMSLKGTPFYMSPELQTANEGGMPSDMWAVGITFYQVLAGSLASPFLSFADLLNGRP